MYSFSILTPTKNSGDLLKRTLDSVLSQENTEEFLIHHYIVDSMSEDHTQRVIEDYMDRAPENYQIYYIREPDKSMTEALNKGLKRCDTEYFGVLNAGDMYLKNTLKVLFKFFCENKNAAGFMFGSYYYNDKKIFRSVYPKFMNNRFLISFFDCHVPSCSVFLKTETVKSTGGYMDKYKYSQDLELYLRIIGSGNKFYINNMPVSMFYKDESQVSSKFRKLQRKEIYEFIPYRNVFKIFDIWKIRGIVRYLFGVYKKENITANDTDID